MSRRMNLALVGGGTAGIALTLCLAAAFTPTDTTVAPVTEPSPSPTYAAPAPGPDTTPETWVDGTPATVIEIDGSWTAADGTTGCTPGAPCDTPCPTEDSQDCYWDAATRSNGLGTSFVDVGGTLIEKPTAKAPMPHEGYVTLNGEKWAYTDGWDRILYCEAPLKVGIDVDDNGNEWAGCM